VTVAFDVVFGVFVAAVLVLAIVAVRWARRRDRIARAHSAGQLPLVSTPRMAPGAPGGAPDRPAT
jgi:hypothetical protein